MGQAVTKQLDEVDHPLSLTTKLTHTRYQFEAMTCPCQIILPIEHQNKLSAAMDVMNHYIRKYSKFESTSLISQINREAGSQSGTTIDTETITLLQYIDYAFRASDGLFDPSADPLIKLWDFKRKKIPKRQTIEAAKERVGWHRVQWDKAKQRIYLPRNFCLNFGGFMKEYISDQMAVTLSTLGVTSGLVNLGGDIRVVGENSRPWYIGVASAVALPSLNASHSKITNAQSNKSFSDTHSDKTPTAVIHLNSGGLATSGVAERSFIVDGQRYSHIISPLTGFPVKTPISSLSVHSTSCLLAGFFSTTALLKEEEAIDWLNGHGVNFYCQ